MGRNHTGRMVVTLGTALVLLLSSCSTDPTATTSNPGAGEVGPTTTGASIATTATTVTTTTTTMAPTTTTLPLTTTTTTAVDSSPSSVQGLTVIIGGGSGEVIPEWDRGSESDLHHYSVWYSEFSGGGKTLLASVNHEPSSIGPPAYNAGDGRTAYVDFPRDQTEGQNCYQISAVDGAGNESVWTSEVCLPIEPPSVVSGFTVDIGGGSGEVLLKWRRSRNPHVERYSLWYSEIAGQTKTLLDSIHQDPEATPSPAYDDGSGVTAYIDFPREIVNDKHCYQISAVATGSIEGARTTEICLSGL